MAAEGTARAAIADQATQWLVQLDAGRADPAAFAQWRDADPRHTAIFAQIAATWTQAADLRAAGLDVDVPASAPIADAPAPETSEGLFSRRRIITGLAASSAIVLAGGGALLWPRRAYAETGIGERRTLRLPDGSHVELNTNSRIGWQGDETLDLLLERGEAALLVTRDKPRAILVRSGGLRATIGAGRLNMRITDMGGRFVVLAGAAEVTGAKGEMLALRAGEAVAETGRGVTREAVPPADLDMLTAWQRGEIVFDGMTLSAALAEFNRYLTRPVALGDASLGEIRLGGRFNTDDPQGFLQSLQEGFSITSAPSGDRILLVRASSAR